MDIIKIHEQPIIKINDTWSIQMYKNEQGIVEGTLIQKDGFRYISECYDRYYQFEVFINDDPKHVTCEDPNKIPEEIKDEVQYIVDRKFLPEEKWD